MKDPKQKKETTAESFTKIEIATWLCNTLTLPEIIKIKKMVLSNSLIVDK